MSRPPLPDQSQEQAKSGNPSLPSSSEQLDTSQSSLPSDEPQSQHRASLPSSPGASRQRARSSSNDSESPGRTGRHQRAKSDDRSSEGSELKLEGFNSSRDGKEGEETKGHQRARSGAGRSEARPASPSQRRLPRQPHRQQSMPLLRLQRPLSSSSSGARTSFERATSSDGQPLPPPSFTSTGDLLRDSEGKGTASILSSPSNWTFSHPSGTAFDWRTPSQPVFSSVSSTAAASSTSHQTPPDYDRRVSMAPIARLPRRASRAQLSGDDADRALSRPRSHSLGTALLHQDRRNQVGDRDGGQAQIYGLRIGVEVPTATSRQGSATLPGSRGSSFIVPSVPSILRSSSQLLSISPTHPVPSGMATQESRSISPTSPFATPSNPSSAPIRPTSPVSASNTKGFSAVKDGKRYELTVIQNAVRARMCGFGDKNRRPLSPAPVAKLRIFSEATGEELDPTEVQTSLLVVTAELRQADGSPLEASGTATSQPPRNSIGSITSTSASSLPASPLPRSPVSSSSGPLAITGVPIPTLSRGSSQSPFEPLPLSPPRARSSSDVFLPSLAASLDALPDESLRRTGEASRPRSGSVLNPSTRFSHLFKSGSGNELSLSTSGTSFPPPIMTTSPSAPSLNPGTSTKGRSSVQSSEPKASATFMRNLVGLTVASANVLKDEHEQTGIFFALHDVSVRLEGIYRLKLALTDLRLGARVNESVSDSLAEASTEPFTVYPPRRFPGMLEPTALSRKLATQGIKIPVRTDKKRRAKGSEEEEEEEAD